MTEKNITVNAYYLKSNLKCFKSKSISGTANLSQTRAKFF